MQWATYALFHCSTKHLHNASRTFSEVKAVCEISRSKTAGEGGRRVQSYEAKQLRLHLLWVVWRNSLRRLMLIYVSVTERVMVTNRCSMVIVTGLGVAYCCSSDNKNRLNQILKTGKWQLMDSRTKSLCHTHNIKQYIWYSVNSRAPFTTSLDQQK